MTDVTRLSSRTVYRNAWMSVREDDVRRADGSAGIYGVVDRPLGVVVVARRPTASDDEQIYLVEQFRYPVGARRWEFPAGTAPDGMALEAVALADRELREETGLIAGRLTHLATIDVAPGFCAQRSAIVLAEDLVQGDPDREHEEQDMRGRWWDRSELTAAIGTGRICDAQTLAAWACVINRGSPPA
ncbi:NUDIX domain-containing protein [Williamsia maris]|uniref:NUDIX domain-containing protein n=1 Tax=Williamsia maris TaxID=72806 RepID=A0ABT1HLD2_9NOCA|nr:NUDIX hydrolase [Williamsia maris]MCP2178741.1 NUDIX domain-containing protein [Williamsia maris]